MSAGPLNNHDEPLSEINVTPLVDVMLVLLVIFILLAPVLPQALAVNLPQAAAPPMQVPQVAELTLTADGRLLLEQQPVSSEQLITQLQARLSSEPNLVVRFNADAYTHYQDIAATMSELQQAGIGRLAFATQPPQPSATAND